MGLRIADVVSVERILLMARRSDDLMAACSAIAWYCTIGDLLCTASWISLVQRLTISPSALNRCRPATSALEATTCVQQTVSPKRVQHGNTGAPRVL